MPVPLNPDALEALMAKTVEELTDADIDSLIEHFRAERANFRVAEAQGKRAPKASAAPVDPAIAALIEGL